MANHRYHLARLSANKKLGGIPASVSSKGTCPPNCALQGNGCYAESGPMSIHWVAVSNGTRGTDLDEFCAQIRTLPKYQMWRHNQAGDLPGTDGVLDTHAMHKLVSANRGRHGFTYTHYDPLHPDNANLIEYANGQGFTVNLSAETLEQADVFADAGVGPVVTLLPIDQTQPTVTPDGRHVIVCPASTGTTTCALCGICAKSDRKAIVGFPAHGSGAKKAQKVFFATVSR